MDQRRVLNFLAYWVGNAVVLLLATAIFGPNVVLGNDKLSMAHAAIFVGLILTIVGYFVPKATEKMGLRIGSEPSARTDFGGIKVKNEHAWAAVFFAANAIVIWIVKRFALILGLGVSSILYVVLIAILLALAQLAVARALGYWDKS